LRGLIVTTPSGTGSRWFTQLDFRAFSCADQPPKNKDPQIQHLIDRHNMELRHAGQAAASHPGAVTLRESPQESDLHPKISMRAVPSPACQSLNCNLRPRSSDASYALGPGLPEDIALRQRPPAPSHDHRQFLYRLSPHHDDPARRGSDASRPAALRQQPT